MESNPTPNYQQVTVEVPEDRIAEFHAFFARFLSRGSGAGPRGRHDRPHHRLHGHRCARRRATTDPGDTTEQAGGTIVA